MQDASGFLLIAALLVVMAGLVYDHTHHPMHMNYGEVSLRLNQLTDDLDYDLEAKHALAYQGRSALIEMAKIELQTSKEMLLALASDDRANAAADLRDISEHINEMDQVIRGAQSASAKDWPRWRAQLIMTTSHAKLLHRQHLDLVAGGAWRGFH